MSLGLLSTIVAEALPTQASHDLAPIDPLDQSIAFWTRLPGLLPKEALSQLKFTVATMCLLLAVDTGMSAACRALAYFGASVGDRYEDRALDMSAVEWVLSFELEEPISVAVE